MNAGLGSSKSSAFHPKRRYKKSTQGCRTCKTRKIKCDEKLPRCGNCTRHRKYIDLCVYDRRDAVTATTTEETTLVLSTINGGYSSPPPANNLAAPASLRIPRPKSPPLLQGRMLDTFINHFPSSVPHVQMLIHHYLTSFVARCFPSDLSQNCSHTLINDWWLEVCVDPLLFHVVLLSSALDMESTTERKSDRSSILLSKICLSLLRKRIEDPVLLTSNQTIGSVMLLAVIEQERGNLRVVRLHMKGLEQIVRLRGGLNAINSTSIVTASLVSWMSMIAMSEYLFLFNNTFTSIELPIHYNSFKPATDDEIAEFTEQGIEKLLATLLLEIRQKSCCPSALDPLTICTSRTSILQRLLALSLSTRSVPLTARINESCRAATILYVLALGGFTYPGPELLISATLHKLKACIGAASQFVWSKSQLIVWILAVGAVSAHKLPERGWFIDQLVDVITELNITSWCEFKGYLIKVLWVERRCEDIFRNIWEDTISKKRMLEF